MSLFFQTVGGFRSSAQRAPLLSGLLLGASFPSYPFVRLEMLAWVALVPLLLSLGDVRRAGDFFRRVYAAMVLYCIISLWWVSLATLPGGILTILAQAFFLTVPFMLFFAFSRMAGFFYALFALPFVQVGWEWLYMEQELSLGWLTFGNSQALLTPMVQYADMTGVWGVSFWLYCFNALAVAALYAPKGRRLRYLVPLPVMVALPLLYGVMVMNAENEVPGNSVRISLVQPNLNPVDKWERLGAVETLALHSQMTEEVAEVEHPDLVIWPETAISFPLLEAHNSEYYRFLSRSTGAWNAALLSGFTDIVRVPSGGTLPSGGPGKQDPLTGMAVESYNAALMLSPRSDSVQVYRKARLVPFAERVPYSGQLPWLENLSFSLTGAGSWGRGPGATLMTMQTEEGESVALANIICYESIFPGFVSLFVKQGAGLLTLVTNDGWYGTSYGPWQHLAIGRFRCIENRRAMARCANTGVSAFIDRFGRITGELPWWKRGVLTRDVPLERELSFYSRWPDLLPKASLLMTVVLFAIAFRRRVLRGRSV
ncbi:MAG: apolipoprotein N-acyltransferase [Chlorobium phaeovibrioides]|nr:apolipoprotein N-acyltransferase [Chlorobium phaeovibrioides]